MESPQGTIEPSEAQTSRAQRDRFAGDRMPAAPAIGVQLTCAGGNELPAAGSLNYGQTKTPAGGPAAGGEVRDRRR